MIKFNKEEFFDFELDEYHNLLNTDQYFMDKVQMITNWIDNSHVNPVPDVKDQISEFIFDSMTEDLYLQH